MRYFVIAILCLSSIFSKGQSINSAESVLISFSKQDIQALNAQNVADLMPYIPFTYVNLSGIHLNLSLGAFDQNSISITKNGTPLLMHQNIAISLNSISLYNVERVDILSAHSSGSLKNNMGITIDLVTDSFAQRPLQVKSSTAIGSLGDVSSYASVELSNRKHTGRIGIGTAFQNEIIPFDSLRYSHWAANRLNTIDLDYNFNIIPGIRWSINASTNWLKALQKSNIIEGTTRVRDELSKLENHQVNTTLLANLSKQHTFEITAKTQIYSHSRRFIDKDLTTMYEEMDDLQSPLDSSKYIYTYARAQLVGDMKDYVYTIGIETSSVDDRVRRNINAIRTVNTDYSIFGRFDYNYNDVVNFNAGLHFLTNNKSGNYILPTFQIKLAPKKIVSFSTGVTTSIAYPRFDQLFYPSAVSSLSMANNLILEPIKLATFRNQLSISKDNLQLQTGLYYFRATDVPVVQDGKWENGASTSGTATFFSFLLKSNESELKPMFVLHGINSLPDSTDLTFFYPELTISGSTQLPSLKTKIHFNSRLFGNFSRLSRLNGNVIQDEADAFTIISASLSQPFWNTRGTLVFGVNNVLNQVLVTQTKYQVLDLNKVAQSVDQQMINRGRNIFLSVHFKLP